MVKRAVGDIVHGKTKATSSKIGFIISIDSSKRQPWYQVRWDDGIVERVSARSVGPVEDTDIQPSSVTHVRLTSESLTELLLGNPSTCDDSSASESSESEDEDETATGIEHGTNISDDGKIIVHDRKWEFCADVLVDPAAIQQKRETLFRWPSVLQLGEKSFAKYLYLMYPWSTLQNTIQHTNAKLIARRQRKIAEGDFFRWLGIRLAMTVEPRRGPLRTYWEKEVREGYVGTAPNFGERYSMSRYTFENIASALSFSDDIVSDDPWKPIRTIIQGFNSRWVDVVSPGEILCVDECMSSWQGKEGKYCHDGMPHKTKIPRKPEGVGAELKSIADGDAGVLLGLDLMEGVERQKQKPYHTLFGEGTAVVLRLSEAYKGSGRTVVADSAFSSVKTLVQLEQLNGLNFMGMVKTATREYPKQYLKEWFGTGPARGDFKLLQSITPKGSTMYSLCWADRKPKCIISNRGTSLPGSDSVRRRHKLIVDGDQVTTLQYERRIQRPQMVELFYSKFSTVDVHDHYRQGSLELERTWHSKHWQHRLFATIFGMVVVDAYLAYRYEAKEAGSLDSAVVDFNDFISQSAHQLIFNEFKMDRSTRGGNDSDLACAVAASTHMLSPLSALPHYWPFATGVVFRKIQALDWLDAAYWPRLFQIVADTVPKYGVPFATWIASTVAHLSQICNPIRYKSQVRLQTDGVPMCDESLLSARPLRGGRACCIHTQRFM